MENKRRCFWVNLKNPKYIAYHDNEWGVPLHDDTKLFEMLILETFQAGLSWECILNKRDAFRIAFDNFDMQKIANYDENKISELCNNVAIIRNRPKIVAAINNARVFIRIIAEYGTFNKYIWSWTDGKIIRETGVTKSDLSDKISADLRQRGMKFVGSTTIYAYLQSIGVINAHDENCCYKVDYDNI